MRSIPAIAGAALVLALTSGIAPAAATSPSPASYLVRPDLRLCPSPLCGGAWIRRANHTRTRCLDGMVRSECYVARVIGWRAEIGPDILVRGRIEPARVPGFPDLARLRANSVWRPTLATPWQGAVFRVRDTGIRCVTAPCFSLVATALESTRRLELSGIDLKAFVAKPLVAAAVEAQLRKAEALVAGRVVTIHRTGQPRDGVELVVTQAWLPAS